jgi:hypothetical protein
MARSDLAKHRVGVDLICEFQLLTKVFVLTQMMQPAGVFRIA